MNVLVIGSGGREHALAWRAAGSDQVDQVFVAPGNAGTEMEPGLRNVDIAVDDHEALMDFAARNQIGLTIVGPENPLADGLVDAFQAAGLPCFGPSAAAARLEGSKAFAKDFMHRHGIPTAAYGNFSDVDQALAFLRRQSLPIVIKADGLAAGKGVIIAQDLESAEATVRDMLEGNAFGDAGHRVVIEEFLEGEEVSFIVMADGKHILPLASSQDHKALNDGDEGPNTGGMGAYSPAPVMTDELHQRAMREIIEPTVRGLAADGAPFTGFLYAGLMISPAGDPRVLEFNVRFGDPETQPLMMRLQSDLVALCLAALEGRLDECEVQWDPRAALGVVMAAGGYPGGYSRGSVIAGLDSEFPPDVHVFHAGTRRDEDRVVTAGGRVLCVTALGDSVADAQKRAYEAVDAIAWTDVFVRRDIGHRAISREQQRIGE